MATEKPRVRIVNGQMVPVGASVVLKPRSRRSGPQSRMPTLDEFTAAQQQHRTLKEIAKHFKCSYVQVQRWHRILFPDGNMRAGPALRYEVAQIGETNVYKVRDLTTPEAPTVEVRWNGKSAKCSVCPRRCGHSRTVKSRIEAAREKTNEGSQTIHQDVTPTGGTGPDSGSHQPPQ